MMANSKSFSPFIRYGEKFWWLISKEFLNIDMAMETREGFWIPGFEETKTSIWVKTHYHLIEMRVPDEIFKFKALE